MERIIKIVILILSFAILLVINSLLTMLQGKIEKTIRRPNNTTKKNRKKVTFLKYARML